MKIVIVGAGPAGLLAAQRLVQRPNYQVHIYEKRSDLRISDPRSLRTYPIGLQQRGLQAAEPDLQQALFDAGTWINGVTLQGKSPTSLKRNPSLYLDRNLIVYTMLNYITKHTKWGDNSSLNLHFETSVEAIELDEKVVYVRDNDASDGEYVFFDGLIAADGANSTIRSWLAEEGELTVEEADVPNHYRTFSIPIKSYDSTMELDDDKVQGWMFGPVTVLMVPSKYGFCSGVMIYPAADKDPLAGMTTEEQVKPYFEKLSPDSLSKFISTEEARHLLHTPVNYAKTAKCSKLHASDCVLFLGDSAHAVSAAAGQACNAALQDVETFIQSLQDASDDWYQAIVSFSSRRLADANALHELSDNSMPPAKDFFLQTEFVLRTVGQKFMPSIIAKHMLAPLPNELLSTTNLSYKEIWEQTRWWTDRVRNARLRELDSLQKFESIVSS